MATVPMSGTYKVVSDADTGNTLEFGESGTEEAGFLTFQLQTSGFTGSFTVVGRSKGETALLNSAAFVPVPYIRVALNGAASDRTVVSAALTTSAIIEVPSSGMSVGLAVTCSAGTCKIFVSRNHGTPVGY